MRACSVSMKRKKIDLEIILQHPEPQSYIREMLSAYDLPKEEIDIICGTVEVFHKALGCFDYF